MISCYLKMKGRKYEYTRGLVMCPIHSCIDFFFYSINEFFFSFWICVCEIRWFDTATKKRNRRKNTNGFFSVHSVTISLHIYIFFVFVHHHHTRMYPNIMLLLFAYNYNSTIEGNRISATAVNIHHIFLLLFFFCLIGQCIWM